MSLDFLLEFLRTKFQTGISSNFIQVSQESLAFCWLLQSWFISESQCNSIHRGEESCPASLPSADTATFLSGIWVSIPVLMLSYTFSCSFMPLNILRWQSYSVQTLQILPMILASGVWGQRTAVNSRAFWLYLSSRSARVTANTTAC